MAKNNSAKTFTIPSLAAISPNLKKDATTLLVEKKICHDDFPLHRHEYLELELILSGEGIHHFNGKQYKLTQGMFYLARPSDFHEFLVREPVEVITLSLDSSMLPKDLSQHFFQVDKNFLCYTTEEDFIYIKTLFEAYIKDYDNSIPHKDLNMQNLLSCILIALIRWTKTASPSTEYLDLVMPALNYINLHFAENPTLQDVADIIHLNPTYFSYIFKKRMNKSYTGYLNELKIAYAKKLLTTSHLNITNISIASGFNSSCHFFKCFKKLVGVNPTEYRSNNSPPTPSQKPRKRKSCK